MSNLIPEDSHILASNILALFPKSRERQENDWQENGCRQSSGMVQKRGQAPR
jgi:hypothetical protein